MPYIGREGYNRNRGVCIVLCWAEQIGGAALRVEFAKMRVEKKDVSALCTL